MNNILQITVIDAADDTRVELIAKCTANQFAKYVVKAMRIYEQGAKNRHNLPQEVVKEYAIQESMEEV